MYYDWNFCYLNIWYSQQSNTHRLTVDTASRQANVKDEIRYGPALRTEPKLYSVTQQCLLKHQKKKKLEFTLAPRPANFSQQAIKRGCFFQDQQDRSLRLLQFSQTTR